MRSSQIPGVVLNISDPTWRYGADVLAATVKQEQDALPAVADQGAWDAETFGQHFQLPEPVGRQLFHLIDGCAWLRPRWKLSACALCAARMRASCSASRCCGS